MAEKKEAATHATDPVYAKPEPRELHIHRIDIALPDNDNDGIKRVLWTISHALWGILAALVILAIVGLTTRPAHGAEVALVGKWIPVGESNLMADWEKTALTTINAERARYGRTPLVIAYHLQQSARQHAEWMASHCSMIHSRGPAAENIAYGYPTIADVVRGWMNSRGHRANILGDYCTTGISAYRSSGGTLYWCQQFSR